MARPKEQGATVQQKLSSLVQWYLLDKQVELKFSYNEKGNGKLAPEYDAWYYIAGRRITERGLAFAMGAAFRDMGYNYALSQVLCSLNAFAWDHYLNNFEVPAWLLTQNKPIRERRSVGRPRTSPKVLPMPKAVNTAEEEGIADGTG